MFEDGDIWMFEFHIRMFEFEILWTKAETKGDRSLFGFCIDENFSRQDT